MHVRLCRSFNVRDIAECSGDFVEATTLMNQSVQRNINILTALIMHLSDSDEGPKGQ